MRKLIMLPIEPLDSRYSTQWTEWFKDFYLQKEYLQRSFDLHIVNPHVLTNEITNGAFLDVCGTNYAKASQLMTLACMIHDRRITHGDIIFLHDAWFPGIEMLAYIRDAMGVEFHIVGCLHAGTYDPTDFISKKGMGSWGKHIENGWFTFYDELFVATEYHKRLIVEHRSIHSSKIQVTWFPLYKPDVHMVPKEKIIVFPHRLTSDKQPEMFERLREKLSPDFPDWQFIKTQDIKRSKKEYYELLNKSRIAVSFALHENWGIAMQEAAMLNCIPFVPDRLAYHEIYPDSFKYSVFNDLVVKMKKVMFESESPNFLNYDISIELNTLKDRLEYNGKSAIARMFYEFSRLGA